MRAHNRQPYLDQFCAAVLSQVETLQQWLTIASALYNLPLAGLILEDSRRSVISANPGMGETLRGLSAQLKPLPTTVGLAKNSPLAGYVSHPVYYGDNEIAGYVVVGDSSPLPAATNPELLEPVCRAVAQSAECDLQKIELANQLAVLREQESLLLKQQELLTQNARFAVLGEMAAAIAHDITNPLSIILGVEKRIRSRLKLGDTRSIPDSLDVLSKSIERMTEVARTLLYFARDSHGKDIATAATVVAKAVSVVETRFRQAGIPLTFEGANSLAQIYCRPTDISQAVVNILNNALRTLAKVRVGHPSCTVTIEARDEVVIAISNNGPKLDAHTVTKLFEPLISEDGRESGSGLGLKIGRDIVQAHGGTLTVEIEPLTRFILRLPAVKQHPQAS
jgi:signal transduction histidine kinase